MESKKVLKLSMSEIIIQLGIPNSLEDIRASYKYDANTDMLKVFETKLDSIKPDNYSDILMLFNKYEEIFDKEIYILHIARLIKRDLLNEEKSSFLGLDYSSTFRQVSENKRHKSGLLETAKNLLNVSDVADLTIDKNTKKVIVNLSQEFLGNGAVIDRRKTRNEKKIERIEVTLGFKSLLKNILPSDLIAIFRYPNLGNILAINLYKDSNKIKKEDKIKDKYSGKYFYLSDLEETIKDNIQYLDTDKLLLLAINVYFLRKNSEHITEQEIRKLKKLIDVVYTLLDDNGTYLESNRFDDIISFSTLKNNIDSLNNRFINGKYYSDELLLKTANQMILPNVSITNYSTDLIREVLKAYPNKLSIFAIKDASTLKFLRTNHFISENELKELTNLSLPSDIIAYLLQEKKIDCKDIETAYLNNTFSEEKLKSLKKYISDEVLNNLVSEAKLIDLYFNSKKQDEFRNYKRFYYIMKIEDRNFEYRVKVGKNIIKQSEKLLAETELLKLYYDKLIPIELVASLLKINILTLIKSCKIKPLELRRMYNDGTINFEVLCKLLQLKDLNDFTKLVLIFSIFSSEKDKKIRNELIDFYLENKGHVAIKNRFEIEKLNFKPNSIWNQIYSLDNEYTQNALNDGTIVFYIPKFKQYIIGKIYNENKECFTYGTCKYVLNQNCFNDNKSEIIKENNIDFKVLETLTNNNKAFKIINSGWESNLNRYFLTNYVGRKYAEEELIKIEEILKRIN